ncbi:MAG TPA: response regulator [Bacteroidales bacterium]|jgi:CheY-like chemotaxis protein|nr:response regulator [Bacteroidales bacterium]
MDNGCLKGKKVLVVEDDFSSRLYLNKILEKTGAVILNAVNGKEAVKIVSETPDLNIILMDIQLPVMDGYMSAKLIREIRKDAVIIAQTAYGYRGDREKMASSFDDYLIKPIYANVLIEKIMHALNQRGIKHD